MKTLLICALVAVAVSLMGCGQAEGDDDDNYGLGYHYDHITPGGIKLRDRPANGVPDELLDQLLRDAAACAGITNYSPPLVVYLPPEQWTLNPTWSAATYVGTNTVVLRMVWASGTYIHRHEFVHVVAGDPEHRSHVWHVCG